MTRLPAIVTAAFMTVAIGADAFAQTASGIGNAVEGDVISIDATEFKLVGIDAPDPGQTCVTGRGVTYDCFEMSRLALQNLLRRGTAECVVAGGRAQGGRRNARCTLEGLDIAAYMVASGWAMAFRRLSTEYVSYEALAVSKKRGFWNGNVEPPWLYRDRILRDGPE